MDIRKKKFKGVFLITTLIILCLCFISIVSIFVNNKTAYAIANYEQTVEIGDITLSDYASSNRTDGKVFDGDKIFDIYERLTNQIGANFNTVKGMSATGLTSDDFRTNNKGNDIVLTLDGKKWTATYLSQNSAGDPILTLWLANSSYGNLSPFSAFPSTTTNHAMRSDLYSSSYVRTVGLNNGGKYAVSYSDTALSGNAVQSKDSIWANFTMDKSDDVPGSLTRFIEVPDEMSWQHNQSAKDSAGQTYNSDNDALDIGGWGGYNTKYPTIYAAWANDKLWLPSVAEVGSGGTSLWNVSIEQKLDSGDVVLLRSTYPTFYGYPISMNKSGYGIGHPNADWWASNVRPAFHLNLAEVENARTTPKPIAVKEKKYYDNGNSVKFELARMTDEIEVTTVSATDMDGNAASVPTYAIDEGILDFDVTDVGKYIIKVKPKTGENWSSGSATEEEYCYKLKYHLIPLEFGADVSSLIYKGSPHYIALQNYIEDFFTVTASTGAVFGEIPAGQVDAGEKGVWATDARNNYRISVSLNNKEFMEWTDDDTATDRTLSFDIAKKTLNIKVLEKWNTQVYTATTYDIEIDCCDEDIGKLKIEGYYLGGNVTTETKAPVQPVISEIEKKLTVTLPKLSDKGTYSYIMKFADGTDANKNYVLSAVNTVEFEVGNKKIDIKDSDLVWRYANVKINNGKYNNISQLDENGIFNVDYNGSDFVFEVDVLALNDDVRDSIDYEYAGVTREVNVGENDSIYTAIFKIKAKDGNTNIDIVKDEFTLKWKINKGLYDLSAVMWDYIDGQLRYTGNSLTVRLIGLPEGLSVSDDDYRGNKEKLVKLDGYYSASVVKFTNSNFANYITPVLSNNTTYIYNVEGKDFPKTLEWRILKGLLILEWEKEIKTDINGSTFNLPQVVGANKDYIDLENYKYYKDNNGEKGEEITLDKIAVGESAEYYWVEAILKSAASNNYELDTVTALQSFKVGSNNEEVCVDIEKSVFEYDGALHGIELSIREGNFSLNKLIIKYYKDSISEDNLLEGAPSNSGKYIVTFSLNETDAEDYYLSKEQIEFEIAKKRITAEWSTSGKSPEISGISETEKEVIEYEYYDENGNVVEKSQLEEGKTYSVKAKIKDEYRNNYEFVGADGSILGADGIETDKKEFEMKAEDPDDPTNPDDGDGGK